MLTRAATRAGHATIASAASRHSTSEPSTLTVQHNLSNCELFIQLPGCDEKAYLQYSAESDDVLDLQHTVVPESFRGRGIAKLLAMAAFDYVKQSDKKMRLTCWYLQKYLKDNPSAEYSRRLVR